MGMPAVPREIGVQPCQSFVHLLPSERRSFTVTFTPEYVADFESAIMVAALASETFAFVSSEAIANVAFLVFHSFKWQAMLGAFGDLEAYDRAKGT